MANCRMKTGKNAKIIRAGKIFLVAALFLVASLALAAAAPRGGTVRDFEYSERPDGGVTITRYNGEGTRVAIPDTLGGRPVVALGEALFSGHNEIKEIYIYEGLREIGESAFEDCSSLVSLSLPNSIVTVGASAFAGCSSLEYVYLPEGLASLGEGAFLGCASLDFIVVTNPADTGSAEYGAGCFGGARVYAYAGSAAAKRAAEDGLDFSPNLPVSSLKYAAFGTGVRITSCPGGAEAVVVPSLIGGKKVIAISEGAFSTAAGARVIVLPDGVRVIGNAAFASNTTLEYIRLPRSLEGDIAQNLFKNCSSLRSVIIPEGVRRIGSAAFLGCTALGRAELPESLETIGPEAFRDCSSLFELICRGGEPVCEYKNSIDSLISFAGVENMKVYLTSAEGWSLSDGKWHPNGSPPEYGGYPVIVSECDSFYIEKIIKPISCGHEGVSEFFCPFCGESYIESYPRTEHNFVSTGMVDGVEIFRCTGCDESYVRYHIEFAEIKPIINTEAPEGSMTASPGITFRGGELTLGVDYTYKETYNPYYNRVELIFSGAGDYVGERRMAYKIDDGRWLTVMYSVSAPGASGGGLYYPNDLVELRPDTSPAPGEILEWSISGGISFMSKGERGASFIMPSQEVSVMLTIRKIETTPPVTTQPAPVTEPPLTETEPATDPLTEPATEPLTEEQTTKPFGRTDDAQQYIKKAIIWGVALFLSLAALTAASIVLFKKDKSEE